MSDAPEGERFEPIVARLRSLHPQLIDLSLDRVEALLKRLDHPERRLPPVIHVAGTNGKGSTCAFLRAIAEAAGQRVHVFTSPHLVAFNERIRLAGQLVSDDALAEALAVAERANAGANITVFEIVTVAAFVLFAAVPADLCVLEVGLGGRLDATNVIPPPACAAITSISLDHRDFLGDTLEAIAGEKAGIIKRGAPVVTGQQSPSVLDVLRRRAALCGTSFGARDHDWTLGLHGGGLQFQDGGGAVDLPHPNLPGVHQYDNAGIAVAAVRAAGLKLETDALVRGIATATWPARLQRLTGRLAGTLPPEWELWLDGGHNEGAAGALANVLRGWRDRPLHLVIGMKQTKDVHSFLAPLMPYAQSVWAVAEPNQHMALPVAAIVAASGGRARPAHSVAAALAAIRAGERPARVLICGSLYLAGEVLKADLGTVASA